MNDPRLMKLIEVASTFAEMWFVQHDEMFGLYHVESKEGDHAVIPVPPGIDKDFATDFMRELFEKLDVERYVYMNEAWTLDSEYAHVSDDDIKRANREGLATFNHPARIEVVMITAENREQQILATRKIIRPPKRRLRLGPLIIDKRPMLSGGRMIGLLRPQGTAH